jgi:UDP-N-acetylmuramoylalanine--D-glutamate ligase
MIELRGKRVLIVGLARSGQGAARVFARRGAVVTVTDIRPPAEFREIIPELSSLKIGLELGFHREATFLRHDLIVVSPGVPWDLPQLKAARARGIAVFTEVEAASWFLSGRLVGITGTNGKTTTTALVGKMLEASGFPTFVGGNIGVPLISAVDQVVPGTVVVAELSSFQLEASQSLHPSVAVLLNITPNHLDRHASFRAYVAAKARIFSQLGPQDYAIFNADDPNVMALVPSFPLPRKIFFSRHQDLPDGVYLSKGQVRYRVGHLERPLFNIADVQLKGAFNLENVLAASAAACVLGAEFDALGRAVREFKGVEHRLEFVRQIRGVDFFNDSKGTSVDATAKALSAFERGVHLILGGKDKGAPYEPLRPLLKGRVKTIYLIGAAADRIGQELGDSVEMVRARKLERAVQEAFQRATPGDTILLSPACASFDQFQDFEHRGRVFKRVVRSLARDVEPVAEAPEKEKADSRALPASGRAERKSKTVDSDSAAGQGSRGPRNEDEKAVEAGLESPIYFYECGAEARVGRELQVEPGPIEEELSQEELRSPLTAGDEPLPFEIRPARASAIAGEKSSAARASAGASATASSPGGAGGGRNLLRGGPGGAGRAPES